MLNQESHGAYCQYALSVLHVARPTLMLIVGDMGIPFFTLPAKRELMGGPRAILSFGNSACHTCSCSVEAANRTRHTHTHARARYQPVYIDYIDISVYIHVVCVCIYIYMAVDQNAVMSPPPQPLLQAFVAAGCFKPFVADYSRL